MNFSSNFSVFNYEGKVIDGKDGIHRDDVLVHHDGKNRDRGNENENENVFWEHNDDHHDHDAHNRDHNHDQYNDQHDPHDTRDVLHVHDELQRSVYRCRNRVSGHVGQLYEKSRREYFFH